MARTISGPALALLLASEHEHWLRVSIENPDGVLTSMVSLESVDWQDEFEIEEDIDRPTMAGSVALRLDTDTLSLAPTMGGSIINRDALDNYAPFLQANRDVLVEVAVTAPGVAPIAGDWHPLGEFVIDKVAYGGEDRSRVILEVRDRGSRLLDRFIKRTKEYGDPDGIPLGDVIHDQLLIGELGDPPNTDRPYKPYNPAHEVNWYMPVAPGAIVGPYEQTPESLLQAMRNRALDIGWELRYRYDAADAFRLTLYEPPRGNVVPDWTIGPDQYDRITKLDLGIEFVRNFIEVEYWDVALGRRNRVVAKDLPSIHKYGERWMEIIEPDDSVIDSALEAQALADAAANDLSEPWAEKEVEMHLFWPVQIGDVIEFEPNLVHYDDPQIFAVVGVRHSLRGGHGTTTLQLRGKVTGAYKAWILRENQASDNAVEDTELRIKNFREIERYATEVKLGWDLQGDIEEIWLWLLTYEQPVTADPWPTLETPNPIRLTGDSTDYTVAIPRNGLITYGLMVPMDAEGNPGRPWQFTVQPNDSLPLIMTPRQTAGASGLYRDLSVVLADPSGLGGTLRVWVNRASTTDPDPNALYDGYIAVGTTNPLETIDATDVFTLSAGGTANLFDDIRVHPGRGKRVYAEFINTAGVSSGVIPILLQPGTAPVDDDNELIAGIIHDYTPFASSVRPYRIFASLPGAGAFVGELVFLTTDQKLYRWTGSAWVPGIATVDLIGQVQTAQIADAAIIAAKIGNAAVQTAHVANLAITDALLAANAVTTTKILDNAITTPKIIAGAVTATQIAAHTITAAQIAALTITAAEIAAGTITSTQIAAATITAANIAALTITAAQIATDTITSGQIASNAITSNELAANSVIAGKIAAASITATEMAANSITATQILAGAVTATKISISTLASIATDAGIIVAGKLQNAAGTQYLDLNASGASGFLVHPRLVLAANGTATFYGDVVLGEGSAVIAFKNAALSVTQAIISASAAILPAETIDSIRFSLIAPGPIIKILTWEYYEVAAYANLYVPGRLELVSHATIGGNLTVTGAATLNNGLTVTGDIGGSGQLLITSIVLNSQTITYGAANSAGAGFRWLRVLN